MCRERHHAVNSVHPIVANLRKQQHRQGRPILVGNQSTPRVPNLGRTGTVNDPAVPGQLRKYAGRNSHVGNGRCQGTPAARSEIRQWRVRVVLSQPRPGAERQHDDPQQPFIPRRLPCVIQRSLNGTGLTAAVGHYVEPPVM